MRNQTGQLVGPPLQLMNLDLSVRAASNQKFASLSVNHSQSCAHLVVSFARAHHRSTLPKVDVAVAGSGYRTLRLLAEGNAEETQLLARGCLDLGHWSLFRRQFISLGTPEDAMLDPHSDKGVSICGREVHIEHFGSVDLLCAQPLTISFLIMLSQIEQVHFEVVAHVTGNQASSIRTYREGRDRTRSLW